MCQALFFVLSGIHSLNLPNNSLKWIASIIVAILQMRNQRQICHKINATILGAWDASVNKTTGDPHPHRRNGNGRDKWVNYIAVGRQYVLFKKQNKNQKTAEQSQGLWVVSNLQYQIGGAGWASLRRSTLAKIWKWWAKQSSLVKAFQAERTAKARPRGASKEQQGAKVAAAVRTRVRV